MPWTDIDLTGAFSFPQADNGSALASSVDPYNAVYLFSVAGQKLNDGYYNGSVWATQIISPANGPQVSAGTALSAFFDGNGGHVFYDAVDLNIHQLSGTVLPWADQDLAAAVKVSVGSGITSFLDTNGGAHLFYIDSGLHVHQLSRSGLVWTDQDLTASYNGPKTATASAMSSFRDVFGYHALYIGTDSHVHQLYFDNVQWVDQDLTTWAKGPQVAAGSGLSSFADSFGEHVFYIGSDQHVHHLNFANGWADVDLTAKTGGPQAAAASAVSSFGDTYGDHVLYIGADQHVHQLYFDNVQWVDQDLTGTAAPLGENQVPPPAMGSPLSSLADSYGEQVFYITADRHVHLLCFPSPLGTPPTKLPLTAGCPADSIGEVGLQYSSGLAISGGSAPYTCQITGGSLPSGLGMNSSGAVSGTPSTAGTFNFSGTVTDATGTKVAFECVIETVARVTLGCPVPNTGAAGQAFSSNVVISGGSPPYTFEITGGSLPQGLSPNPSSGAITGTPTTTGTSSFSMSVTDGLGGTATINCGITINGTLVVIAWAMNDQATAPDGPQAGLTFCDGSSGQPNYNAPVTPTSTSTGQAGAVYTFQGISPNITALALGSTWVNDGFWLCSATGGNVPLTFPVTMSGTTTIFVAYARPL